MKVHIEGRMRQRRSRQYRIHQPEDEKECSEFLQYTSPLLQSLRRLVHLHESRGPSMCRLTSQ